MTLQGRPLILLQSLTLSGLISSCTPAIPLATPPKSYKGPIAERRIQEKGDYWVYQLGNSTSTKTTALATNVEFPLWIGRIWSYEGEAVRVGQSPTTMTPRIPTRIDCHVTAFRQLSVATGTFESFECECQCTHQSAHYEPGCGEWTIWYAPAVKQIIRTKTGSTATTAELIEYRASHPTLSPKVSHENR